MADSMAPAMSTTVGVQHRMAAIEDKAPLGLIMFTALTLARATPLNALWKSQNAQGGDSMFLKELKSGHLVQVVDPTELVNPLRRQVSGRYHHGEEAQEAEPFSKGELVFPSGETLPRCWVDPHYRDDEIRRTGVGV